jgi:octaprenyl-diphosphate synthase
MTIHRLRALVSDDFNAVNDLIIRTSQSPIRLIDDLSNHIIQSGGKRLRPLLILLTCQACGYQGNHHITLATMIEFFHTATLLHDDVIDESALRRGRDTAHQIWGSKASILVGDYLFTRYMQLMIGVGNLDIMRILTDAAYEIGCGEIKQLSHRHDTTLSTEDYFEVIRAKTSLMFSASCQISAVLSQANQPLENALKTYGLHLGNAFQLTDDALDYCADATITGKNIGDDLADGKVTMPLLYVLQQGTPTQQQLIKEAIAEGSLKHLPSVLEAITETRAIEYTRLQASHEMNKALLALEILPHSIYKEALIELAKYAISRDH